MKHNIRWYNNRIAEKQKELEAIKNEIKTRDWSKFAHLSQEEANAIYDKEYQVEQEIRDLEHDRDTRNWTGAEWNSWNLMIDNVD
jgi:cell division protein FtsL